MLTENQNLVSEDEEDVVFHERATLVGETMGERPNSYSENDEMVLPNSKLELSYSTRFYQVAILFLVFDIESIPDVEGLRLLRGLEIGVNDYLLRPVDKNELLARARTQIRRRRYTDQLRDNMQNSIEAAITGRARSIASPAPCSNRQLKPELTESG